jgi:hypothetical protein
MKEIPGYEGRYACDENGNIYSLARIIVKKRKSSNKSYVHSIPFRKRIPCLSSNKYLSIPLKKDNIQKSFMVHRLIALTFLDLKDEYVNHKDGNKLNNKLSNLELCSCRENTMHAYELGLRKRGKDAWNYFITEKLQDKVIFLWFQGYKRKYIAEICGMSKKSVDEIKSGIKKSYS